MVSTHNVNYDKQLLMDRRRGMVSELIVKRPGITQRQITAWLGELEDIEDEFGQVIEIAPRLVNPETSKPFSLATIVNDIKFIRKQWRDKTSQHASEWLAQQLAALSKAEAIAWRKGNTAEVRAIWQQRNKILGLETPIKIARTNADGSEMVEPSVITVFVFNDEQGIAGKELLSNTQNPQIIEGELIEEDITDNKELLSEPEMVDELLEEFIIDSEFSTE